MKKTPNSIIVFPVVLALLLSACSLDDPNAPTGLRTPTGPQVFKNYVAVGNSLTAGFMDSGLMADGQKDSFPRQIARAIGIADENFTQPWVGFPGLGTYELDSPVHIAGVLHFDGQGIVPVDSTLGTDANIQALLLNATQPAPYHNLGVPGAWAADILSAIDEDSSVGDVPFFTFINRSFLYGNNEKTATVLALDGMTPIQVTYQTASTGWQAIAKGPTLVTLWMGNNDILGGATGGDPTTDNMTDPNAFAATFSQTMQILAGGLVERTGFPATIVVANIPGITDSAFFLDQATFEQVAGGPWPWGWDETGVVLYTFPVLSFIQNPANQGTAIPSHYTLTAAERGLVDGYVGGFNTAIDQIVTGINASGMAKVGLMDANQVLADLPAAQKTHFMLLLGAGMDVPTAAATTLFALDGVHPNNKGYGVVANAFIDVINDMAGTSVAHVDVDALVWDPTYGQNIAAPTKSTGLPRLSPAAARQMTAIWQR